MAKIKVTVDGKEYTEDQFEKDFVRMFDAYRKPNSVHMGSVHCEDVDCNDCPLNGKVCDATKIKSFATIKTVYEWTQKHQTVTNANKFEMIYKDGWMYKEHKKPKGE